jgi:rod shape-determining protein MreB
MGIARLEGDFTPVEVRAYSLASLKTHSDYTVIATDMVTRRIIAIGKEAYQYIDSKERTSMGNISVYSTFKRNVVAEFDETVAVMKSLFKETLTGLKNKLLKPTVVVCIPFELTGVEKKAFEEVFLLTGGKQVTILECDFEDNKNELAEKYRIVIGIIPNQLQ